MTGNNFRKRHVKTKSIMFFRRFKTAYEVVKYIRNWYDVFLLYFRIKNRCDINYRVNFEIKNVNNNFKPHVLINIGRIVSKCNKKLKVNINIEESTITINDCINLPLTSYAICLSLPAWLKFLAEGGKFSGYTEDGKILIQFNNKKFILPDTINGIYEIVEVFFDKVYDKFDFKNKIILDIGGFIGDTAVFFALSGAKRVIMYEPNPELYHIALRNIHLNNCEDNIEAYNQAVAAKEGKIDLVIPPWLATSNIYGIDHSLNPKRVLVETISIKNILKKEKIDILKMDCEGCEYELLETILYEGLEDRISEGLILEVHYIDKRKNPKYAIKILKNLGFSIYKVKENIILALNQ